MPYIVLFSHLNGISDELNVPNSAQILQTKGVTKRKRKFSVKTGKDDGKHGDRRSQLPISTPSGFIHLTHVGPNNVEPLQSLLDESMATSSGGGGGSGVNSNASRSTLIDLYALNTTGTSGASKNSANFNPVMRSTSSSSAGIHGIHRIRDDAAAAGRPLSSHSRNSDGSSLGKDTKASSSSDPNNDSDYLEPISSGRQVNNASTFTQNSTD
uniref:CRIB domain-containing protein n=1 Tax=Panagrolaimus superbus TaxID=310955 RepID=A0A914YKP2_9BILA